MEEEDLLNNLIIGILNLPLKIPMIIDQQVVLPLVKWNSDSIILKEGMKSINNVEILLWLLQLAGSCQ